MDVKATDPGGGFQEPGQRGPTPIGQQMHHRDKAEAVGAYDVGTGGTHGDSRLSELLAGEDPDRISGGISSPGFEPLDVRSPGAGFPPGDAAYRQGITREVGNLLEESVPQRNFDTSGYDVNLPGEHQRVSDEELLGDFKPTPTRRESRDPNRMGPVDRAMSWMWPSVKKDWYRDQANRRANERLGMEKKYYGARGEAALRSKKNQYLQVGQGSVFDTETGEFKTTDRPLMRVGKGVYDPNEREWVEKPGKDGLTAGLISFLVNNKQNPFGPEDGEIHGLVNAAIQSKTEKERLAAISKVATALRPYMRKAMEGMADEMLGVESIDMTGANLEYLLEQAMALAGAEGEAAATILDKREFEEKFNAAKAANPEMGDEELIKMMRKDEGR